MDGLISETGAEQLVSVCRTAAGEKLRSITYFTHDDYEQVYLRSDLEADADLSSFIGLEWHGFETTQSVYRDSELGGYRYTLRGFENGYLLRVTTQNKGVFITTDGLTLADYESVATALRELLEEWERQGPPAAGEAE
ncbi:MAG: hypothetical protein ABEJ42_07185 [Halobacteriaceae archaeon]